MMNGQIVLMIPIPSVVKMLHPFAPMAHQPFATLPHPFEASRTR